MKKIIFITILLTNFLFAQSDLEIVRNYGVGCASTVSFTYTRNDIDIDEVKFKCNSCVDKEYWPVPKTVENIAYAVEQCVIEYKKMQNLQ
ncbi:MAG: hypothetical protein PHX13_11610 [Thiovulaceae bacterium]|nr:hypothetical protein [Sulfurimonadaceae bacterium]